MSTVFSSFVFVLNFITAFTCSHTQHILTYTLRQAVYFVRLQIKHCHTTDISFVTR
jgi:hypothetical protein